MPKETITTTSKFRTDVDPSPDQPDGIVANTDVFALAVGWNPQGRWVQVNVIPQPWQSTGDWTSFDLDEDQIDHLIRALRRAKRQAFGEEILPGVISYGDEPSVQGGRA